MWVISVWVCGYPVRCAFWHSSISFKKLQFKLPDLPDRLSHEKTAFMEDSSKSVRFSGRAQIDRMSLGTGQENKFDDVILPSYVHNLLSRYLTVQLMCDQNTESDFQASENGAGTAEYVRYISLFQLLLSRNSCFGGSKRLPFFLPVFSISRLFRKIW